MTAPLGLALKEITVQYLIDWQMVCTQIGECRWTQLSSLCWRLSTRVRQSIWPGRSVNNSTCILRLLRVSARGVTSIRGWYHDHKHYQHSETYNYRHVVRLACTSGSGSLLPDTPCSLLSSTRDLPTGDPVSTCEWPPTLTPSIAAQSFPPTYCMWVCLFS